MQRSSTSQEATVGKVISTAPLLAGPALAISFRLVGREIDENAILRETFGPAPIA